LPRLLREARQRRVQLLGDSVALLAEAMQLGGCSAHCERQVVYGLRELDDLDRDVA
jgi:hypothetical protein